MVKRLTYPLLQAGFLFLVVFVPLAVPAPAAQTDEIAHWVERTHFFLWAVTNGFYANTVQTEHPGVTVVAFASLAEVTLLDGDETPEQRLYWLRLPLKVVNALLVALGFLVMRRLFAPGVAFLGALLWATEPYLRWHMRLLHIDGLTTNFMALAFLLLLLAYQREMRVRVWALTLAAFVAGLAALTRFSSFYLVGMAGVLALLQLVAGWQQITLRTFITQIALPVIVFALVAALTWAALYPGMWVNARGVYEQTLHGFDNAATPHGSGNFFLGEAVANPGVLFYPVALLVRVTPWTLAGVVLAGLMGVWGVRGGGREKSRPYIRTWLAVVLYALLYLLMLTVLDKKFDRYALPVYPVLAVIAAAGWLWAVRALGRWRVWGGREKSRPYIGIWVAVIVILVGAAGWYLPHEYAYTNPIVGGARAQRWLIIGGGEGLQDLRGFYNQLEAAVGCDVVIATSYTDVALHHMPCARTVPAKDVTPDTVHGVDYFVSYVNFRQRYPAWGGLFSELEPVYRAEHHGIVFVEVYDGGAVRAAYAP